MQFERNESGLDHLIDCLPVPALLQDGEKIVYANDLAVSLYRYGSKADFIGTPVIELIHDDDRAAFAARHDRIVGNDMTLPVIEQKRVCRDGQVIHVLSRGATAMWQGRRHILGIQIDLTARKEAERLQARNESWFRVLVESSTASLLGLDQQQKCTVVNPQALRLLGYADAAEISGRPLAEIFQARSVPGSDRPAIETQFAALFHEGKKFENAGVEILRRDGAAFPGAIRGEILLTNGTVSGFLVVFCDIGSRLEARRLIREQEEALRILQAELATASRDSVMGNLSTVIAHELMQPLSAIINTAGALKRDFVRDSRRMDSSTDEKIELILSQSERASAIISGIRRLFEHEQRKTTPESVNTVISDACAVARAGSIPGDILFELDLAADLPAVRIDRIQIQQVVYNLVQNAADILKESPEKRILIETATTATGAVRITVHDTGPGVSEEIAQTMFEPFATSKVRGMGMGLYICQAIVDAHDGRIWVETGDGRGTSFHIELPAVTATGTLAV